MNPKTSIGMSSEFLNLLTSSEKINPIKPPNKKLKPISFSGIRIVAHSPQDVAPASCKIIFLAIAAEKPKMIIPNPSSKPTTAKSAFVRFPFALYS